jgi:hypothetical protein
MMDRARFLKSLLFGAGATAVGPKVWEEYERLTHRKVFALGGIAHDPQMVVEILAMRDGVRTVIARRLLPPGDHRVQFSMQRTDSDITWRAADERGRELWHASVIHSAFVVRPKDTITIEGLHSFHSANFS